MISPGEVLAWWDKLRRESTGVGEDTREVAEPFHTKTDTTVLISLGLDGEAAILAEIDPREAVSRDLGGRNIGVTVRSPLVDGRPLPVIELVCQESALEPVFAELAVDVIRRISNGLASRRAIEQALEDFRNLLQRDLPSRVGMEEAIGLVGELLVLEKLVGVDPGSWRAWNGPLGETHDFMSGEQAIEVKASAHVGESRIEIHGLDQLNPPAKGLYLFHLVLVPDPKGNVSVPMLSASIQRIVDDESGFIERLNASGFHPSEPVRWEDHRFSLSSMTCFDVSKGFPKLTKTEITGGELPAGIGDVRYSISLASIRQWQVSPKHMDQVFSRFVSDD
ncbi:PD-(D/E)XK motif protein [Natronospira bacteriovora]|uniref:PD-(D/E)XK motif protein n=1 Tax=Natronospira bacteriovora TaxID=3069753 RepID=A0ABU0W3Q0_9GAMM|nr:PD-(D/E)XK motif protein [Natronospira sp. AB-CW4]MDQ2068649.1 PD-(D/E)XK motif protein [Natronospira sp. AB-CW4]